MIMRLKKEKLSLWLPDNFSCQKGGQNPKRFEDHRSHVMFLVNEREKKNTKQTVNVVLTVVRGWAHTYKLRVILLPTELCHLYNPVLHCIFIETFEKNVTRQPYLKQSCRAGSGLLKKNLGERWRLKSLKSQYQPWLQRLMTASDVFPSHPDFLPLYLGCQT